MTPLIDVAQAYLLPDVLFIDCRFDLNDVTAGAVLYEEAQIPGAHYLDLDKDLSGIKTGSNGRHPLPDRAKLSDKLRQMGVNQDTHIIVYDAQGGIFAARAWWLLRWLGCQTVQVLDGGLHAWIAQNLPLAQNSALSVVGNFTEAVNERMPVVKVDEVLENLHSHTAIVLDARAADRFRGKNETMDPIGGHIPGAKNRHYRDNLTAGEYFKPVAQLKAEFQALLGEPSQVIHQCGSGVSACHNLLAMEVAGLSSGALYPGSWSEWCADVARPIACD